MSTRLLATDVFTMPLEDESAPGVWVEGGWPNARTQTLADLGDVTTSIWEITTGVVADIENDECFLVLSGTGHVRFESGDTLELKPGAFLRFRAGDRTEWTVLSTVRALTIVG